MLEKIAKTFREIPRSVKNTATGIAIAASIFGAASCAEIERQACLSKQFYDLEKPDGSIAHVLDCRENEKPIAENHAPKITLTRDFPNNGLDEIVKYNIVAEDEDGIDYANILYTDENPQTFTSSDGTLNLSYSFSVKPEGELEVDVCDNLGECATTKDNYGVASEEEAREGIEKELDTRGDNYTRDEIIYDNSIPPNPLVNRVDYFVDTTRNSQGFFVLNYISDGDDFTQAKIDKQTEDDNDIENYNFTNIPIEELSRGINQIPQ